MLLDRNPLKGLTLPKQESPKRPLVMGDRYEAMLRVADEVDPRFGLALVLAHATGHRIGAIRRLRWSDIDLRRRTIRWRAENDKLDFEHVTPIL
jgi:integrase